MMFKRKRKNSETNNLRWTLYVLILFVVLVGAWQFSQSTLPPYSAEMYYSDGVRHYEEDRFENAVDSFSMAITLDDEMARAYNMRGRAYRALGDYDAALADYEQTIALDNDFEVKKQAYNNRCYAYNEMGEYELAIEDCTTAIQLDAGYAYAYSNRCHSYTGVGAFDLAMSDCDRSIALNDTNSHVFKNQCLLYNSLEEYELALDSCNHSLELEADFELAYAARGLVYYNMGSRYYTLAIADYERYAEITGDYQPMMVEQIAEMEAVLDD